MKQFGRPVAATIKFQIDDDEFECAGTAPMGAIEDLLDLAIASDRLSGVDLDHLEPTPENLAIATESITKTTAFLDSVMLPDSAKRFAERMRDPVNPITADHVNEIATWLMEQYSARPTTPPSLSSNGHGGAGTSSTDGAPAQESTPETSPSTGSST